MTVRLDSLGLCSLSASVLGQLSACKSLHLQHNRLTSCSTLAALPCLTFLALAHNQLQQVIKVAVVLEEL
jgi:Leucine-rich repeat (LRR) protein